MAGEGDIELQWGGGALNPYNADLTLAETLPVVLGVGATANTLGTLDKDNTVRNVAVNSVLSGSGGLTIAGGGAVTMSALNTYTGDTTVSSGQLTLADGGALAFAVSDLGSNQLLGGGSLLLDGTLAFDLSGVTGVGSWDIVASDLLANTTYGDTFGVTFAYGGSPVAGEESDGVWSYTDESLGVVVSFTESTGMLAVSAIPEPGTLALLACGLLGLAAYAWRRRK